MDISMNLRYYSKNIGVEKAASFVSAAGIKLIDYTPAPNTEKSEWSRELKIFEKNDIKVYQCHAPFNRYGTYGEEHKKLLNESLDMAKLLGARYLVVHGDEFDFKNKKYSAQAALEYNYEYFAQLVEKAANNGIYVAFENVFEENFGGNPRYSSNTEDLIRLIDKFDNEYVCCCWDFGHGAVQLKENCVDAIKQLGKRIQCTHVHDNNYYGDLHMVPFFGNLNWNKNMSAIKDTSCEVLSFELVYGKIPQNVVPSHVKMMADIGKELNKLLI